MTHLKKNALDSFAYYWIDFQKIDLQIQVGIYRYISLNYLKKNIYIYYIKENFSENDNFLNYRLLSKIQY